MPTHLIQFSTGLGSAEVARRAVAEYGINNVHLLTADTLVEDEDNWRFAQETWEFIGKPKWITLADGRTPMQVGRDLKVVPNNRLAVCSRVLKRELLRNYIEENYTPADTVIHLGFDWTEPKRLKAAIPFWEPWAIDAILARPPYVHKQMLMDQWRAMGIEPPRLYDAGFGHANCGGACVRGGQAAWEKLLNWNRDRYIDWETEEEKTRAELGKDVTILRDRSREHIMRKLGLTEADVRLVDPSDDDPDLLPYTVIVATGERLPMSVPISLREYRGRLEEFPTLFDADDVGACGCYMDEGGE